MIDVLCIGHACYDICLHVDTYPVENSKAEIRNLFESGGGPAANAAYLLSKWGVDCAFAGLVGNDPYGLKVAEEFKSVGTDITLLDIHNDYQTPLSIILVNKENGSRTIINRKVANSFLSLKLLASRNINPKILLFDGHEPEASLEAIKAFPEAITVLDAGSLRKGTEILSKEVDYLLSSDRFAMQLTGLSNIDSEDSRRKCIEYLKKINKGQIVMTLGEKGLIYSKGSEACHMPAFKADTIDTTAAGDIFHGAFVYGLLANMPLIDILKFSSMTASLSVQAVGGRNSIPLLKAVKEALLEMNC